MLVSRAAIHTLKKLKISSLKFLRECRTFKSQQTPTPKLKFGLEGVKKIEADTSLQKWLVTFEGRRFMAQWVGFGGTVAILAGFWCFKLFMMEWVRDEYKEDGSQVNLKQKLEGFEEDTYRSPHLLKLLSDCQDRAGLDDVNISRVDVFFSNLIDPVVGGCTHTRQGGFVGVPRYITEEPDLSRMKLKTHYNKMFNGFKLPENIDEEDRKELLKCLTLSTSEKNFLMSFCLARAGSWYAVIETIMPAIFWVFHYILAFRINSRLDLLSKPRHLRFGIQALFASFSICFYLFFVNASNHEADFHCLDQVCKTIEDYEVAIGYFEKVLDRNKVLRRVVGEGIEYYIQPSGELEPMFYEFNNIGDVHVKLKHLKDQLEKL